MINDELLGGHQAIVDELFGLVGKVREGDNDAPRVVLLKGASGTGKSRIIRELYERLRENETVPRYWSELSDVTAVSGSRRLDPMPARKELGPRPAKSSWPADALPSFGWWTFSCDRKSYGGVVDVVGEAAPQLDAHLLPLTLAWRDNTGWPEKVKASRKKIVAEVRGAALDETIGFTFDTLEKFGVSVPFVSTILSVVGRGAAELAKRHKEALLQQNDTDSGAFVGAERQNAGVKLATVIRSVTHVSQKNSLPGLVLIEDAHLLDAGMASFMEAVVTPANGGVLIIATVWPEGMTNSDFMDWHDQAKTQPGLLREIDVPPLSPEDLIQLVSRYAPATNVTEALALVQKLNTPHFLKLWLSLDRTREAVEDNDDAISATMLTKLPDNVRGVLELQWDELPDETKDALALAAVSLSAESGLPPFLVDVLKMAGGDEFTEAQIARGLDLATNPAAWCLRNILGQSFREQNLQDVARDMTLSESGWTPRKIDRARLRVQSALEEWIHSRLDPDHLLDWEDDQVQSAAHWLIGLTPTARSEEACASFWALARKAASRYEFGIAIEVGNRAVDILVSLRPDDLVTLNARSFMAWWTGENGHNEAAVALYEQLVADYTRIEGEGARLTLLARGDLAKWIGETGQVSKAVDQLEQLTADYLRVLGPDDHNTMDCQNAYAQFLGEEGDASRAVQVLQALKDARVRVFGADNARTLVVRNDLGLWLGNAERFEEAITELTSLLLDQARILNADGADTDNMQILTTQFNLATVFGKAGRPSEALERTQLLLVDVTRVLGPDNAKTLATRINLAKWLARTGQVPAAIKELRDLVSDWTRLRGSDHLDTLYARHELAWLLGKAGQHQEALSSFQDILVLETGLYGPDHPNTLTARANVAHQFYELGQVETAIEQYQALMAHQEEVFGNDNLSTVNLRKSLATLLFNGGDAVQAQTLLARVLADYTRILGVDHDRTVAARTSLAFVHDRQPRTRG